MVCSLFLSYVFGLAASHAAQEFSEVKYSRTEGVHEYVQRLKTKAHCLARKPDESTMIIRFLAGLPSEISQQLTLRERLDPARHCFKHFVVKLHELEEAENVTKPVHAAVVDEQQKTGVQGPRWVNVPQVGNRNSPYKPQCPMGQREVCQPIGGQIDQRPNKGKGVMKFVFLAHFLFSLSYLLFLDLLFNLFF